MHHALWVLIALLGTGLCSSADSVSLAQAREIAQAHGASGTAAPAEAYQLGDASLAICADGSRSYRVDLSTGAFLGWTDAGPVQAGAEVVGERDAVPLVARAARQHIGEAADLFAWQPVGRAGDAIVVFGEGPRLGDPPRSGLSPSVLARVRTCDGAIVLFSIDGPDEAGPQPVNVTADRALWIGREALDDPAASEVRPPRLWQRNGAAVWSLELERVGTERALVEVDASNGEVRRVSRAALSTSGAAPDAPCGVDAPCTVPAALGAGALAALASVRLGACCARRRRRVQP